MDEEDLLHSLGSVLAGAPVVQSIVSLASSLRGQLLIVLRLYNQIQWYFLLKKWEKQRPLTFFRQKILAYLKY